MTRSLRTGTLAALLVCACVAAPVSLWSADLPASSEALAQGYEAKGEYENARREWLRVLATTPARTAAYAEALRRLGWIEYRLGHLDTAQTQLQEAQALYRQLLGGRSFELARTLSSLGAVRRDRGDYVRAQADLESALAMLDPRKPQDAELVGTLNNNLAGLWYYRSDYRRAVVHYRVALETFERLHGDTHVDVAGALNNLGIMYKELGASREALSYLERALVIKEKLQGPDHPSVGSTLNNLADLSAALGDGATAAQRYDRALRIFEQALGPEHPNVAHVLANRGEFRMTSGDSRAASADLERALAIREKAMGLNSNWVAETLVILGPLQGSLGEIPAAQSTASRALALSLLSGEKDLLCNAYAAYARVLDVSGDAQAAAFYGKHAVNVIQGMRAEVAQLGEPLQQSFLAQRAQIYRDLAERLVVLGRLSEAEQILKMLKEEEYFDYVRNALRTADTGTTRAQFSRREQPLAVRLGAIEQSMLTSVAAAKPQGEESQETVPVSPGTTAALKRFMTALHAISDELDRPASAGQVVEDTGIASTPAQGVAELQYFLSEQALRILVRTASSHRAVRRNVDHRALNRQVFEVRQALQDPKSDPLPLARKLHDELIAPVRELLALEHISTLQLTLDGTLRYVPFAALHDGKQFLIEEYAIEVRTSASGAGAAQSFATGDRIAAFGVSSEVAGLPPLPRVRNELERIVRRDTQDIDGVIPGTLDMDRAFTQQRLDRALKDPFPLMHLATHFVFRPGSLADSYLVLGDGTTFSLQRLQSAAPDLSSIRLLTLSACSSALGDDAGAGRELESFGTLAQRLGVREVLATLWPVADNSTAVLMADMYRGKAHRGLDTAHALRQAQLALLAKPSPWRHPMYWAPFVVFARR